MKRIVLLFTLVLLNMSSFAQDKQIAAVYYEIYGFPVIRINNSIYTPYDMGIFLDFFDVFSSAEITADTVFYADSTFQTADIDLKYANGIDGCWHKQRIPICDVSVKGSTMSINVYALASRGYRIIKTRYLANLSYEEVRLLSVLEELLDKYEDGAYIDTSGTNWSRTYNCLIVVGSGDHQKTFFYSERDNIEPRPLSLFEYFILSLVRKYCILDFQSFDEDLDDVREKLIIDSEYYGFPIDHDE
ncbi:MAG: hypothetical protein J6X86_00685 [Bacteroidales bacterium]|nr:hypothetical protein [Bacteroidales bacterium]